ncbi:MAG: hypothetical protein ACT4P6_09745 [Gemmatimonadaceae bacterium]
MDEGVLWAILMQRLGGWCAIVGAALLIAAGVAFGGIAFGLEPEVVLQELSLHGTWYWTAVHAAFVAGAFCWIVAFMGLNTSFRDVPARVLGHAGAVCLMLGVGLYAVNSFVSGTALTALAERWQSAPAGRAELALSADTLLAVLRGTWTGVVILFHGVPFVLMGTAVSRDARYPRALRWLGVMGGVGAVLTGGLMLAAPSAVPPGLYLLFGAVTALWMVGVGIVIKRPVEKARRAHEGMAGSLTRA